MQIEILKEPKTQKYLIFNKDYQAIIDMLLLLSFARKMWNFEY